MERLDCRAGKTQISRVLAHAKLETKLLKVSAASKGRRALRRGRGGDRLVENRERLDSFWLNRIGAFTEGVDDRAPVR